VTVPPGQRRSAGEEAEALACRYLEERGLAIVSRNVRARGGEIDIVAREGDVLVFVEVRSREDDEHGLPEESVGAAKRRKIAAAAREYIRHVPPEAWREARFDVVAVEGSGEAPVIRHYPGAFDAKGKIL
jgi:putative endonuclease